MSDLEAAESMRCTLSIASCLLLESLIEGWEGLYGPNIGDYLYLFISFFLARQSGPCNQNVSFPVIRKCTDKTQTLQFKNGVLRHNPARKLHPGGCKYIWRLMVEDLTRCNSLISDLTLKLFFICFSLVSVRHTQILLLNLSVSILHEIKNYDAIYWIYGCSFLNTDHSFVFFFQYTRAHRLTDRQTWKSARPSHWISAAVVVFPPWTHRPPVHLLPDWDLLFSFHIVSLLEFCVLFPSLSVSCTRTHTHLDSDKKQWHLKSKYL